MAFQRSRGSRLAGDLCRDAAHEGGAEGADQQDGPQRCARHSADDAGGALPPGACEDATQSETANAADPSQTAAVQGHRYRPVSYTHLRAHETRHDLVCRLLLEKKKKKHNPTT